MTINSDHHPPRTPWRKLLHVRQPYPDNYVDDSFLESMQRNVNVRPPIFTSAVYRACIISQYLCSVTAFVGLFRCLYISHIVSGKTILTASAFATAMGLIVVDVIHIAPSPRRWLIRRRIAAGSAIVLLNFALTTPILSSLTRDISSDTIWALVSFVLLVAIVAHHYVLSRTDDTRRLAAPDSVAVNACTIASVLLASRLNSFFDVLALLLLSAQLFALLPVLCNAINFRHFKLSITLTLTLFLLATGSLWLSDAEPRVLVLFALLDAFIVFVCPMWLMFAQQYKTEIRGPWDEARLAVTTAATTTD